MGEGGADRRRARGQSLRDLRIAEVTAQDVQLKDGKVELFRTKLKVSFKYEKGSD